MSTPSSKATRKPNAKSVRQDTNLQHRAKGGGRKVKGFVFKRGGIWIAGWTAFGKRNRRSTGIECGKKGSKEAALAKLAEFVAPYHAEEEADVRAALARRQRDAEEVAAEKRLAALAETSRIPLADAWARYPYNESQATRGRTAVHPLSPRNIHENEVAWDQFVRWAEEKHGKGVAMQDVTEEWAKAYSKHLQARGLTPSRHNFLLLVGNVMFRLAHLPSPFADVPKLKKQVSQRREPFTKEQVAKLLLAARGEWRGFLAVCYFTGLRAGDAVHLRHEQISNGKIRLLTAKTGKEAVVYEKADLADILAEPATATHGRRGYLFPTLAEEYDRDPAILSARFARFAAKALGEIEEDETGAKVLRPFDVTEERQGGVRRVSRYGLHALRHSFAAHEAAAGTPLAVIKRGLGHSAEAITRIYAEHASDAEAQRWANQNRLFEAEKGQTITDANPAKILPAETLEAVPANVAEVAKLLAGADAKILAKVQALLANKEG